MGEKKKVESSAVVSRLKQGSFWSTFLIVLLIFGAGFFVGNSLISGRVVMGFDNLFGTEDLVINLREGELLPANSTILIEGSSRNYSISLADVVDMNSEGSFFVDGFEVDGEGEGYGEEGSLTRYPDVLFTLVIESVVNYSDGESITEGNVIDEDAGIELIESVEDSNVTEEEATSPEEEATSPEEEATSPEEEPEEEQDLIEETGSVIEESLEADEESQQTQAVPADPEESPEIILTGEAIAAEIEEVEGVVSYNSDFTYHVGNNSVGFKPGSIAVEGEEDVDYLFLDLDVTDGEATVSTDYIVEEEGFGEVFLGEEYELRIDLEEIGVNLSDLIRVSLVYKNESFAEADYSSLENSAQTKILDESLLAVESSESIQYAAVVGRPVKWVKVVNVSENTSFVEVPRFAENISVIREDDIATELEEASSEEVIIDLEEKSGSGEQTTLLTGHVSIEIDAEEGVLARFLSSIWEALSLTGNVVLDETEDYVIVNVSEDIRASEESVGITYYTPAPISNETVVDGKKRVIVSAEDEYNYSDVLVYSSVWDVPGMDLIPMDSTSIQIKWYPRENISLDSRNSLEEDVEDLLAAESVEEISEKYIVLSGSEITKYDVDSDGYVDFIAWVVPHLSAQTFEITYGAQASQDLFDCGTLSSANTVYILQNDVSTTEGCFTVVADNVTLDLMGYTVTGDLEGGSDYGVLVNSYNNFLIRNGTMVNFYIGVALESSAGHTVTGLSIMNPSYRTIWPSLAHNITISESNLTGSGGQYNVEIYTDSTGISFLNNNIYGGGTNNEIIDYGAGGSKLIYNNSFGEIKWTDTAFLNRLSIVGDLTFPGNINISSNFAYLNSEAFGGEAINSSANVTLRNTGIVGTPKILKDGVECSDCVLLSSDGDDHVFNVSSWSNYTLEDANPLTDCATLSSADAIYTLQNNVITTETCFTITAANITLNLNGFNVTGDSSGADYGVDVQKNYTTIKNGNIYNFYSGIQMYGEGLNGNNLLSNLTITQSTNHGIICHEQNNIFSDITSYSNGASGIDLWGEFGNNTIINFQGWGNAEQTILDNTAPHLGKLIYNNSFGQIVWTNSTFLGDMTTTANITFPGTIQIANNSAYLNSTHFTGENINSSANVTLYDTGLTETPKILKDGVNCADCILLSSDGDDYVFSVTSWSNYTLAEAVKPNVTILNPLNGTTHYTTNYQFNITANDNVEVDSCWMSLDNWASNWTMQKVNETFFNYTYNHDPITHTARFACNDTSGNINDTEQTTYTIVDGVPPTCHNGWSGEGNSTEPCLVTECGNLNQTSFYYELQNDVSTTGTCFSVTAANVTLDLNGYAVSGDESAGDKGVHVAENNFTINNGTIELFGQYGIYLDEMNYSTAQDLNLSDSMVNLYVERSDYNSFTNIIASSSTLANTYLASSSHNVFNNLSCSSGNQGVYFDSSLWSLPVTNNTIYNLDSYSNTNEELSSSDWGATANNFLIYNNSYGEVKFIAQLDSDLSGDLVLGDDIQITSTYIYLADTLDVDLNTTANLTFHNTGKTGSPRAKRANSYCSDCSRLETVSDSHTYNVTGFGNYTVDYQNRISLGSGWNMISLGVAEESGASEDVNITLNAGWNLVGYSGVDNATYTDLQVDGQAIALGVAAGKVQKQFIRKDATVNKFKMAPYHESSLVRGRAYWVYANESNNLTIPNGKPSAASDETISLSDIRFTNGEEEKTLAQAVTAEWVSGTSTEDAVWYYNVSKVAENKWENAKQGTWNPFSETYVGEQRVGSWDGYYIKGLENGIELVR